MDREEKSVVLDSQADCLAAPHASHQSVATCPKLRIRATRSVRSNSCDHRERWTWPRGREQQLPCTYRLVDVPDQRPRWHAQRLQLLHNLPVSAATCAGGHEEPMALADSRHSCEALDRVPGQKLTCPSSQRLQPPAPCSPSAARWHQAAARRAPPAGRARAEQPKRGTQPAGAWRCA